MYVPTIPRVLVLPIVTASLAAAVGCSCLTPEESASLESAGRNYTLGNYSDALGTYTRLAHGLETRGCSEAHLARLREAACLIRLGRHEEAARALERVPLRELEPELQREFWFADATNSLALGRDTEPVFESDEAEKRRRKADATALYRKARRSFELVLETKPDDYEALLGRGLASLRLGILNSDDQFLQMATDTLRLCKSQRDDDKRATFSLGLAILHGPGRGQLTRNAADLMLDALRSDIEGNFDYHEAYFDLLVFLHPFATPPELARGFAQRSDLLPTAGSLVDHLEEYAVRGRVTEGASNQERLQQIRNWLAVHRQWAADERDAKQRVVLANDTIRQGGRPVVDKYTAAMEIVEGVKAPFRSEQAYVDCRGDVQRGYVEVLMRFSDLLTSIRELDSAQRFVQTAMKRAERPWIADPSPVIIAASTLDSRIEAYRGFDRMTTQCRELIAKDEPEDARRKFDIYELRIKGTPEQVFVDERIAEFRKEIERSGEVAKISEFFDAGARERAADPKTALEKLLEAEKLALEANLPAWKEMVQRSLAELYFETGRYQESLETLRRLQQSSTLRKPSDALLQAQCYLRTGEIEGVCTLLGEISDTSFFNDRDKAFAGTSFLAFAKRATKEPERRERLARAREFLEAAAPRDSAVIEARKTCYRELWQSLTSAGGDPRALENVLESLVLLDPDDRDAHKALAFQLFEKGSSRAVSGDESDASYRRAYDLLAALDRSGELALTAAEKKTYDRLLACYADFMPLARGNRWVYRTTSGKDLVVSVTAETDGGHFEVEIATGASRRREVWQESRTILKRFDTERMVASEIPIRLLEPTRLPTWSSPILKTTYDARVVATGAVCETPAGTFENCLKIELTDRGAGAKSVYWFAPGVGEVKMESDGASYALVSSAVERAAAAGVST